MKKLSLIFLILITQFFIACGGNSNGGGEKDENKNPDENSTIEKTNLVGSLNLDFANTGFTSHHNAAGGNGQDFAFDISIDKNDNIYTVGYSRTTTLNYNDLTIWKYKTDGTIDTSFGGGNGYVTFNNADNTTDRGFAITNDSNGNVYVTGYERRTASNDDMLVLKYSSSGVLDNTFGTNGRVADNTSNGYDSGNDLKVDSSGNIFVVGYIDNGTNNDMTIWKYKANGTLDNSFDGDGKAVYTDANSTKGNAIDIDKDGKIYIAGYNYATSGHSELYLWRYNSNGSIDTSFGNAGKVVHKDIAGATNKEDEAKSVKIDSSGNIFVTGLSTNSAGNKDMILLKFKNDGSLDNSFNTNGIVIKNAIGGVNHDDAGSDIVIDDKGNIYISAGTANAAGHADIAVLKYKPNGSIDTSFNNDGIFTFDYSAISNSNDYAYGIKMDSKGYLYLAGGNQNDMLILSIK